MPLKFRTTDELVHREFVIATGHHSQSRTSRLLAVVEMLRGGSIGQLRPEDIELIEFDAAEVVLALPQFAQRLPAELVGRVEITI